MMRELSGADFLTALEQISPDQATRLVFMTGGATFPSATRLLATALNASLQKPFSVQDVLDTVDLLCPKRAA